MAPEKTASTKTQEKDNVFVRLLSLPAVSSTYEVIERTYTSTKQTHPLLCSVCGVYERGARTASSLAVWSIQPAIDRLETQLVAANNLACKGLDHLEEKIPALQYPPEKLASGIVNAVTSTVQTAKEGIASPIAGTSDRVLSMASSWLQLTSSAFSDGFSYVLNSKPVHLAGEGADTALTLAESLVNYVLPGSSEENESAALWEQESGVSAPGLPPSYRRLGALASTVCRRAYNQTAATLQHAKSQGQDLVTHISGVSPLTEYAMKNLEAVETVGLFFQSSLMGFFSWEEQRDKATEAEFQKVMNPYIIPALEQSGGGLQRLVSGLGYQLQINYMSVVSSVKSAPQTTFGLAKNGLGALLETVGSARDRVVNSISYYVMIPGLYTHKDSEPGCSAVDEENSEPKISDEARLLKQRVLLQIPQQQRMILGQSYTPIVTQRIPRRGEIAMRSRNSSYTHNVQSRSYSPTAKYVVTVEPIQKDTTEMDN
ncbi:perilipin-1 isoform X1 [Oncorhynchus tshawytscha]|uniref:Perilipin n=1 Tax=Oncorhynchus tshawytscha TaxID=74940 RepID=A0A8C8MHD1_ONCTS|nr:perilipin-1 isoform X1 [Oncorhynchus tshawytscha]